MSRLGLAPLQGARTQKTLSGGRFPLAPNDHRLPSGNPAGWLPFQSSECPYSTTRHPMKLKTFLLTALLAVVYVLHQDFWNWKEAYPLVFGFLRSEEHTSELQ